MDRKRVQRRVTPVTKTIVDTEFRCTQCNPIRYYDSAIRLQQHKATMHGTKFKCPDCNKSFGLSFKLRNHGNLVHGMVDPYFCKEGCDETFPTKSSMDRHKLLIHSSKFSCSTCGKKFRNQIDLNSHFQMDTCGDSKVSL